MAQEQNEAPYKIFRAGKISVSLWQNEATHGGRNFTQYSVKIQKRYCDKDTNEWKTTDYLYRQDLPDLIVCAQKAFESVSLTEVNNNGEESTQ